MPNSAQTVNEEQLGRLLKAFRDYRRVPRREVLDRFDELFASHREDLAWVKTDAWLRGRTTDDEGRETRLRKIESGVFIGELDFECTHPLAAACGFPDLMLDPLLSDVANGDELVESVERFQPTHRSNLPLGCGYAVPQFRLEGTDPAFVRLDLEPASHTISHSHPGDELLLVLHGEIEVRLENSGLRTSIGRGDYVHFCSEQPHSAWNLSQRERAVVLVVRFYQLKEGCIRRAVARAVDRMHDPRAEPSMKEFKKTVYPWLYQITRVPDRKLADPPDKLLDPVGLGRLIQMIRRSNKGTVKPAIDQLAKKAREQGSKLSYEGIRHLANGVEVERANRKDLTALANALNVEPVLFYGCLFPPVPNSVVVRKDEDLKQIVPPVFAVPGTARYALPIRNLAGSDISLTFLTLGPRGRSPKNHHPGHELIIPLEGEVAVHFKGGGHSRASANELEYAHFRSMREHWVANTGRQDAEVFAIRFYG